MKLTAEKRGVSIRAQGQSQSISLAIINKIIEASLPKLNNNNQSSSVQQHLCTQQAREKEKNHEIKKQT